MQLNLKYSLILILTLIFCSGCARPLRIDGPYVGKIIDADTKQPIEGVVVDATWARVYPNVAGSSSEYYDNREAITDKNGEFSISGMGLLFFSFIDKADITIFKAGYDGVGPSPWQTFDEKNLWQFNGKITRNDDKLIVRLKKLSMSERKNRTGIFPSPNVPNNKRKLYIIERNKEMKEIGRSQSTLLNVE